MEYEPSLHGSAALAPSGQKCPSSQATHACSPSPLWYVPAAHATHSSSPVTLAKLPALHNLGAVFPPEQYLVTGHVSQSASETKVTPEGRKVPGKHAAGMRTLEPGGQ